LSAKLNIASIVGARPQLIKAAVLSRALRARSEFHEVLIHTGQHYDNEMSRVFFEELAIPQPDFHLGVGSASHTLQTARMLERLEEPLVTTQPQAVLVYGDTNSTLAGALAAAKLEIPVVHVEAGLRSFDRRMPEEINRVVADHLAALLFAPTKTAVENLRREGLAADKVRLVGDVMYDAALFYEGIAVKKSNVLERLKLSSKGYVLATVHRAANTDTPSNLRAIMEGLEQVARNVPVVFPLHPRTRVALERDRLLERSSEAISIVPPVGYLDMALLERNARLIATDSGGVQKEAFFYRVPCVTLRGETEWTELVALGWNRLVAPVSSSAVFEAVMAAIGSEGAPDAPYGNGGAAELIAQEILRMGECAS